ncbi:MAG: hypothetical protein K6E10_07135 [Eubacterium sp.]|nr:hypothetical protein [Eubacterium sp.]
MSINDGYDDDGVFGGNSGNSSLDDFIDNNFDLDAMMSDYEARVASSSSASPYDTGAMDSPYSSGSSDSPYSSGVSASPYDSGSSGSGLSLKKESGSGLSLKKDPASTASGGSSSPYGGGSSNSPYGPGLSSSMYDTGNPMGSQDISRGEPDYRTGQRPTGPNHGPGGYGSGYDYASRPVVKKSGGINPLFIIIPVLLIIGMIGYSLFDRVFGKADYIPGTVTNNVYTNEFFGYKMSFNDNWTVQSDVTDPDTAKKLLNSGKDINECTAYNYNTGSAVMVGVKQTLYNTKEVGTDVDKLIEDIKEEIKTELPQEGMLINDIKNDSVTVGGKTCKGFMMECTMEGVTLHMGYYIMFKDNYVTYIGATAESEGKARKAITDHVSYFVD